MPDLCARCLHVTRIVSAALIILCAVSARALAQSAPLPVGLTLAQEAIVYQITESHAGENVQAVAPSGPIGERVRLPFRDGKFITIVRSGTAVQKDGGVSWRGVVEETGEQAHLILWGSALLTGYFAYNGTVYSVESPGGGISVVSEMDRGKKPSDHAPSTSSDGASMQAPLNADHLKKGPPPSEPQVEPLSDARRQELEAKDVTIDLMMLYTADVAKRYLRDPTDMLALAITDANATFTNSGLGNVKLRLVYSQQLDYDGSVSDQFNHLYRMVDGIGIFKDVRKLRDEYRADIVGLVIDNANGCGLSTRVGPESDEAFFVVHHACATTSMTIPHEIGHILGARHDRLIDQSDLPFPYGHGYVNGTKWRDVMSYKEGCGGCPRIPLWSNPRVKFKGEPTGTAASDTARVILELAERVSKFR